MKKGFTLAEILITLAIIGVVAALTIPTLMVSYQKKQYYTQFMKEYNALSKAIAMAQVEHGPVNEWKVDDGMSNIEFINKYLGDSLKISKICASAEDCGISEDLKINFLSLQGVEEDVEDIPYSMIVDEIGALMLGDGSILSLMENRIRPTNDIPMILLIDINGVKAPNTFGRDLFAFALFKTKKGYTLAPENLYHSIQENNVEYYEPRPVEEVREELDGIGGFNCITTGASQGIGCGARLLFEGKMNY